MSETFRKIPEYVDAMRWDGSAAGYEKLSKFIMVHGGLKSPPSLYIHVTGGITALVNVGDWVIVNEEDVVLVLSENVFGAQYESLASLNDE